MAVVTGSIILGVKLLIALISFILSYGVLIIKMIICWGGAILFTFWVLKNFAAVGQNFDLLDWIDNLFLEGVQCDYSVKDGQLSDNNPKEINDPSNQARMAPPPPSGYWTAHAA